MWNPMTELGLGLRFAESWFSVLSVTGHKNPNLKNWLKEDHPLQMYVKSILIY